MPGPLQEALEEADFECNIEERRPLLTVLVAGGGFAGVETVAAVNDFVREATGSESEIQTQAEELAEGEDTSYPVARTAPELGFRSRPLAEGIASYVAWIQRHPAAQGRARA